MSEVTLAADRTVRESVCLIANGQLSSAKMVEGCLQVIDSSESELGAWATLDREQAVTESKAMDEIRRQGKPLGELHGIPVGIKDIYDTSTLPTERGTPIHAGRQTESNAAVVEKLREAGAVILGKTVTTEFAYMHAANTRNPHNVQFSPGGSSSGSAASVAAGHVPLAIGSQTNGSVIRPASFCGVYGFKPSRGVLSRRGALQTSETLDQVGVFARDLGDIALLTDSIKGYDAADSASYLAPRPAMLAGYLSEPPIEPNLVWIDMPYADRFESATQAGCEELLELLGQRVERIPAPESFSVLIKCHSVIHQYEIYRNLKDARENHWEQLSTTAQTAMKSAEAVTDEMYQEALGIMAAANDWFSTFFHDYDAIVTPSALGEAPRFGNGTGDPICCTVWTLCGLPCLSLPLLSGENDLPVGVQLIGSINADDRLLRTARWLLNTLRADDDAPIQQDLT